MNFKLIVFVLVFVHFAFSAVLPIELLAAETNSEKTSSNEERITAFVNVNVVPMDTERVLLNQTVIVKGGRIVSVGAANEVEVPDVAKIVEGNGGFLMPGLADMHMHFSSSGETFKGPEQLVIFLAEGVTTVRIFSGMPKNLDWREKVTNEEIVGPSVYTSGPVIIGIFDPFQHLGFWGVVIFMPVVVGVVIWLLIWGGLKASNKEIQFCRMKRYVLPSLLLLLLLGAFSVIFKIFPIVSPLPIATFPDTEERARQAVRDQASAGYDFIKVYDYLNEEIYLAIIDEANKQNIYIVGHLLDTLTPGTIFNAGLQEVAHIDEFTDAHMIGEATPNSGFTEVTLDYASIPESVNAAKANDVIVVSNMVTDEVIYQILEDVDAGLAQPEYDIVAPDVIELWRTEGRFVNWQGQETWRREIQMPFFMTLTKALHEGGVPLLIGTDMTVEGMVPSHIHRDLKLLVEAGLSPFEALEAGTKNAGMIVERMGRDGRFGIVEEEKIANLILVEENPLVNVSNTRNRVGVMTDGKWYTQDELDILVNEYMARY